MLVGNLVSLVVAAEVQEGALRLLVRLAKRKHGTDVAGPVATLLAGIDNPDRLQDVGEWIVDCEIGGALLARLQGTE
ncbi:MAG: hypothetical protein OXC19_17870 [Bryobacterales bacterium]|nr:hypothetical protein [Bryobacterales bacterium]